MPAILGSGDSGLLPGGNPGGSNVSVPSPVTTSATPSLGSSSANPFLPQFPSGTQTPPLDSTTALAGMNPANLFGFGGAGTPNQQQFTKDAKNAGMSTGVAELLFNFLQSGAGFNPEVAQAMIAAMRPGEERAETNLLEQFGKMGMRNSSAAAIGLGDLEGQEQLNEGQIFAGLYEQSVQNYMSVLMGMPKRPPKVSGWDNYLKWLNTMSGFIPGASGGGSSSSTTP